MMHLDWRPVAPGDGPAIFTSVTALEADELARLAEDRDVLEVGSAYGYSAVVMALAGGRVTSVDSHEAHAGGLRIMTGNVAAYGVRVDMICAPSQIALPRLAQRGALFGLVFIDGDHTAAGARHDLRWALQLLDPGGTLAVHDVLESCCCPGVREAVDAMGLTGRLVDTMLVTVP